MESYKRLFYVGKGVEELKSVGLIFKGGRYATDEVVGSLYFGRSNNKKRLMVIANTSFHIDLNYDKILYNFIKENRNLTDLRNDDKFFNYAICKNGEIVKTFDELLTKDINFGHDLFQKEADKNFNGDINAIDDETKKDILMTNYETNPYKNPYFITDTHYQVLVKLIDNIVLEDMEYF